MAKKLYEFLDALSTKPALLQLYESDPQTTMKTFGLGPADRQLLTSGSDAAIRNKLQKEMKTKANAYVIRMA